QELRGSVLEKQSPANALVAYQAALRSLTQIRDSLDVPDLKLSFASRTAKLYEHVFSLLIADGRDVEAFDLVEKARARTFLDQLARTDAIPAGRAAGQFDETLQLRRAISTLEAEARVSGNQLTADELRKRRESYAALLKRVHAVGPASRAESAGPLQSDAIRKALDADTTLVAYYLTASESHAFVLTRTSPPMRVKLPLVPADLDRTIRTLHDFASVTSAREIEMLSDALIAPILPQLKTRRLVIVPFGSLHYVPFAALKVSTAQVLADRFELVELPAASVLPLLSAGGELKTMFVIGAADVDGLPSLKDTKGMLHRVAAKFGTTPLTGAAATEEAFWSGSSSADILFVMAHGKLQADAPLFSRFYLAPSAREDGLIEIQELQNRRISARLVVLGACQTQLGATTAGDDVVALNRAFLASGASAVVATLWRVPKQASEMLLETFFLRIHAGDAPAAALQAAQRRVREEEQYADPYYWAGFVLNGYS
ncbi:MAG: hypothetical protein QOE68_4343, partial [Thermoanaerobaculia bacterium]|nr:hypothetical protein [Thermoanaerobaculia bacterium]